MVYFAFLVSGLPLLDALPHQPGLKLRSVGENPKAADSLGVNGGPHPHLVRDRRWRAHGLAGAYLPMTYTGTYTEGIVGGPRLAGHRPGVLRRLAAAVHPRRGRPSSPAWRSWPCGCRWAASTSPASSCSMLPYVATLLVMMFALRWASVPAFLGRNYDRESRPG